MAQKQSIGTATTQSIVFNSGYLTVNGFQIADVSDVTVTNTFSAKDYRTLNSIIKRAIRRATLEQSVKFTIDGGKARQLYAVFFSASSVTSDPGKLYTVRDGQQNPAPSVMVTCYEDDDTTKAYQYVLTNPVLTSHNVPLATEAFAKVEVEIMCTQLSLYVDDAVSN